MAVIDIVKEISEEYLRKIKAGETYRQILNHRNAISDAIYSGFNQLHLGAVCRKFGLTNNKWLGFAQVGKLKGRVHKYTKTTPLPFYSYSFKYAGLTQFSITAYNRSDADKQAFEKDPTAVFISSFGFFKYHQMVNVLQTTLADKFPVTPGYEIMIDPVKARHVIFDRLSADKKDYFDRKLISMIGASFLTRITPDDEEIDLVSTWLDRLDEKPSYLYSLSNEAGKLATEILNEYKAKAA